MDLDIENYEVIDTDIEKYVGIDLDNERRRRRHPDRCYGTRLK